MVAARQKPELIAIVGPTASGKSELAMRIAKAYQGEIIAADSRTVYKGMDIGTAKPTLADQMAVPHWALDILEPGQKFTVAQFKKYAEKKIDEINQRGHLPILAGGSGLYLNAVLFGYEFSGPGAERNPKNPRHLKKNNNAANNRLRPGALIVGIMPPDKVIKTRISKRAEDMFKRGIIDETRRLAQKYGEEALQTTGGIVYVLCLRLLKGEISQQQALAKFNTRDWQYARRQRTWFRRNKFIHWFNDPAAAYVFIKEALNN